MFFMGKMICLLVFLFLNIQLNASVKPDLKLEVFSSGFSDPLAVRNDGVNNWLFVVQRNGEIYIIDSLGVKSIVPFLDIKNRVLSGGERGLLGLAFHPSFKTNQLFVVNYTRQNDGATVVSTFKTFENDPKKADPNSEKILLTFPQPFSNHNGGDIHFAKDGNLYIGTGDGGDGGDPNNNAQNLQSFLGKMLRIYLETDSTYSIPKDNPFKNDRSKNAEIWNFGLRNPWRFSFDRLNDDLWIADVGQSTLEEVNHAQSPRTGGENYGWRCFEGNQPYNNDGCNDFETYTSPIFTYDRSNTTGGRSITGGYVYRGSQFQDLYGYYVCADYLSKNFWLLKENERELEVILKNNVLASVTSFGEDIFGELYATSFDGKVYKVGSKCSDLKIDFVKIEQITCPAEKDGSIQIFLPNPVEDYNILWSTGSTQTSIYSLMEGWYSLEVMDNKGCKLVDSFKIFSSKELPEIMMSGDSLITSSIGLYQWLENGNPIDTATDFYIIPQQNGLYQVEVIDSDNCKLLSNIFELNINSLNENRRVEMLQLYPNPSNDMITIKLPENLKTQFGTIRIFDINGRVVIEEENENMNAPISLRKLSPGVYFVELSVKEIGFLGRAKVIKLNE